MIRGGKSDPRVCPSHSRLVLFAPQIFHTPATQANNMTAYQPVLFYFVAHLGRCHSQRCTLRKQLKQTSFFTLITQRYPGFCISLYESFGITLH